MPSSVDRHGDRALSGTRAVALALSATLGALGAFFPTHAAPRQQPAATAVDARSGLVSSTFSAQPSVSCRKPRAKGRQPNRSNVRFCRPAAASTRSARNRNRPPGPVRRRPASHPRVREELRRAASSLTTVPPGDAPAVVSATRPVLALLERVRSQLEGEVALGLSFEGSYRQTKPKEQAYGGHASAMGPAPANVPSPDDGAPVTVAFEEGAQLPARTYCGGPTKDHILESACGGVALFDYDGDGLLDVYLVTAAELTPARERVPHQQHSLPESRRMEVRGRVEAGGRRPRGLGERRVRRGLRRRRPSRSLRDELGAERPVPQPRQRHVRGRRREGRSHGRRMEHGLRVLRRRRRRRPRPVRRPLRRDDLGFRAARASLARLAQRTVHHGRPRRTPRRARPLLRKPRQRTVQGSDRRARLLRFDARVRIRRPGHRL